MELVVVALVLAAVLVQLHRNARRTSSRLPDARLRPLDRDLARIHLELTPHERLANAPLLGPPAPRRRAAAASEWSPQA